MQRFARFTRSLDRFGIWATAYTVVSGLLTWVWSQTRFLGEIAWPEFTILGLASALAVMLGITSSLALWRKFHPLSTAEAAKHEPPMTQDQAKRLVENVDRLDLVHQELVEKFKERLVSEDKPIAAIDAETAKLQEFAVIAQRMSQRASDDVGAHTSIVSGQITEECRSGTREVIDVMSACLNELHAELAEIKVALYPRQLPSGTESEAP